MGQSTSKIEPNSSVSVTLPSQGTLTGTLITDIATGQPKTHRFTGIPYAFPPTGSRRWRRPVPLPSTHQYSGSYHSFTSICPSPDNYAPSLDPSPPKTTYSKCEDCLHLNIWIPASRRSIPLPVLFFIHGGWLQTGNANFDINKDPSDLITEGGVECIIVSAGYRLNVFGFLAHEALREEEGSVGNYGFWDQRMALEWVYRNISHFGGDSENITVGGLSAGAHSAHSQLMYEYELSKANQDYRPIIRRVFQQSNAAVWPTKTVPQVSNQLEELCALFNFPSSLSSLEKITRLRGLRDVDLAAALSKMEIHTFRAVRDEIFVKTTWYTDMMSGKFARWCQEKGISFLLGETDREESVYELINFPTDTDSFVTQLHNYYPIEMVRRMVGIYGVETGREGEGELYEVLGVGRKASKAEIRASYLSLVRQHHPDKTARNEEEMVRKLNNAYATLSDDTARESYDLSLSRRRDQSVRISAVLDLDALSLQDESEPVVFNYPCRCGYSYSISSLQIEQGIDLVCCEGCSEVVRVVTGELQRVFGTACADSQVYTASRTLVQDLVKGGLNPNALLRYRCNYRAAFLDRYTPKEMGVSNSFDDAIWWYAMCGGGWDEETKKVLKEWLRPFAAFLQGKERDHVAKAWYGEDASLSQGQWLRILEADATISLAKHDDRWAEKRSIITAMQQARKDMLN